MFDWLDNAVEAVKQTASDAVDAVSGKTSAKKQEAAKQNGYDAQSQALKPPGHGGGHYESVTVPQTYKGQSASGSTNAGSGKKSSGGSWWDRLWGDDEKKDEGPVHVPMKTDEPPERKPGEPSYWEREQKRKKEHNLKVSAWKEYERNRLILNNKLAELRAKQGMLDRNPYGWQQSYILEQRIKMRGEMDQTNAELAALKEPKFKRPQPYDYYVGV